MRPRRESDRLRELRADRALGLLSPAGARELRLSSADGGSDPDDYELAAAAVWLASSGVSGAPLPADLRSRLVRCALEDPGRDRR